MRNIIYVLTAVSVLVAGCATPQQLESADMEATATASAEDTDSTEDTDLRGTSSTPASHGSGHGFSDAELCNNGVLSRQGVGVMLPLTQPGNSETIYTTFQRIDRIAALFETCGDPWGLFPTTYRHITRRIIQAIENNEIEDTEWGHRIVVDFAGRYLAALEAALTDREPSFAWKQYYYLADRDDVSRTRAVVVAMVAHLTLDLPYSLVDINSTDDHKDDYFVLGELMIEITPDFIQDLRDYYDTDAEDFLTGFVIGDWVDSAFGQDTMITFSYQTIRTKSWNNSWYLQQWWGTVIAEGEIYAAFWNMDGVLATLDATGAI